MSGEVFLGKADQFMIERLVSSRNGRTASALLRGFMAGGLVNAVLSETVFQVGSDLPEFGDAEEFHRLRTAQLHREHNAQMAGRMSGFYHIELSERARSVLKGAARRLDVDGVLVVRLCLLVRFLREAEGSGS